MTKICPNCGGKIEPHEPKCSYCGYLNLEGAEEQYLERLDDIKDDLSDVKKITKEEVVKEVADKGRRIRVTLIVCLAVVAVVAIITAVASYFANYGYIKQADPQEQLLWEKSTYPMLDDWYEEGNYDAILDFRNNLYDENSEFNMAGWEHFTLIRYYGDHKMFIGVEDEVKNGWDAPWHTIDYMLGSTLNNDILKYEEVSSTDLAAIEGYITDQRRMLVELFEFTEDELDAIYKEATADDIFDYDVTKAAAKKKEAELYD